MNTSSMQSRISEAVGMAVLDHGQRGTGRIVGHDGSTISRWGSNLSSWSASALLALASADEGVRATVVEGLTESQQPQRRGDALRDTCAAIAEMSAIASHLARDLGDGAIAPREAKARRPEIRELIAVLHRLDADLAQVAKGASRV